MTIDLTGPEAKEVIDALAKALSSKNDSWRDATKEEANLIRGILVQVCAKSAVMMIDAPRAPQTEDAN